MILKKNAFVLSGASPLYPYQNLSKQTPGEADEINDDTMGFFSVKSLFMTVVRLQKRAFLFWKRKLPYYGDIFLDSYE